MSRRTRHRTVPCLTSFLGSIGAATFISEATLAATAAVGGNVVVGVVIGFLSYIAFWCLDDTITNGMVYT